jgi:hypothetical protein
MRRSLVLSLALTAACAAPAAPPAQSAAPPAGGGPALQRSDLAASVQIHLAGVPLAVGTSVKVSATPEATFRSKDHAAFKVVALRSVTLNEALDATGGVVSRMATIFTLKHGRLSKLNRLVRHGELDFAAALAALTEADFDAVVTGARKPPDPKTFARLRNALVYTFTVEDAAGVRVPLQVYVERFRNASEL